MAEDFEACAKRCTFESSCRYYSFWLPGRANGGPSDTTWCRVTASCERLLGANSTVVIYQRIVEHSARQLWFQSFGMCDSGNNLLLETLVSNFPFCCQVSSRRSLSALMLPAKRWCVRLMGMEKHANPHEFLRAASGEEVLHFSASRPEFTRKRRIAMVTLVRDPLAQLAGWKKSPHGLMKCVSRRDCSERLHGHIHKREGSHGHHGHIRRNCSAPPAWVTQPCNFSEHATGPLQGSGRVGGEFASLPDVWNAHTSGYLRQSGYARLR
mmetsp:Transcript_173404/g.550487  ORF Transcript_173404/g.550487 Transcript_173404/m.550487 type:complete len:268 (-) Transcript_173404:353-1156(-)